jgi:hypothetical protein
MPSTDRKLELKANTLVAQTGSQPFVYAKGLKAKINFNSIQDLVCATQQTYYLSITQTSLLTFIILTH